jgi:23S rRNA pseudouridine1911/1915/1917 synthase
MSKSRDIVLGDGTSIPILYEDRNILAIDKPPGWMLAPSHWDRTGRNLQLALEACVLHRDYWARSRNVKFLRFVHRLDAETSGILLLAKSPGALSAYQKLFETRQIQKLYLAVVQGASGRKEWTCRLGLAPDPQLRGRMKPELEEGRGGDTFKDAETHFKLLGIQGDTTLLAVRPQTGRTHQIRVHLLAGGHSVIGDALYGAKPMKGNTGEFLGLRAVGIAYREPFTGKDVRIEAPVAEFLARFGFKTELASSLFVQWMDKPDNPPASTHESVALAKHQRHRNPNCGR